MTELTVQQATQDAVAALKAAGFGKPKRPAKIVSWPSRDQHGRCQVCTEVTVRSADHDDAIRVLIVLPGAVTYGLRGKTCITVWRDATLSEAEYMARKDAEACALLAEAEALADETWRFAHSAGADLDAAVAGLASLTGGAR